MTPASSDIGALESATIARHVASSLPLFRGSTHTHTYMSHAPLTSTCSRAIYFPMGIPRASLPRPMLPTPTTVSWTTTTLTPASCIALLPTSFFQRYILPSEAPLSSLLPPQWWVMGWVSIPPRLLQHIQDSYSKYVHLTDHNVCHEIGVFICLQCDCAVFYCDQQLEQHQRHHHPQERINDNATICARHILGKPPPAHTPA